MEGSQKEALQQRCLITCIMQAMGLVTTTMHILTLIYMPLLKENLLCLLVRCPSAVE